MDPKHNRPFCRQCGSENVSTEYHVEHVDEEIDETWQLQETIEHLGAYVAMLADRGSGARPEEDVGRIAFVCRDMERVCWMVEARETAAKEETEEGT